MDTTLRNEGAPGVPADAEPALERAERVVRSLVKLIHGKKLYARNNPRLVQFRREYSAALMAALRSDPELVLGIDQYAIRWGEHEIYRNEKREESIAFLLHKDGVGELTIGAGALGRESDLLADILTDEFHRTVSDEDVVTRFWNADFEHISYRVLDDYLTPADPTLVDLADEPVSEPGDHEELRPSLADRGRVVVRQGDALESIEEYLRSLILRTCASTDGDEREAYFQSTVGSFFTVSKDETSLYQDEVKKEARADGLAMFVESVMVFTLLHDNPAAVRDVIGVVERVVSYCVSEENPRSLAALLALLRDFETSNELPGEVADSVGKMEDMLSDPALVDSLAEHATANEGSIDDVLEYFRHVGSRAVDPVLRVLHHTEGRKLHRNLSNVLLEVAADELDSVIDRLDLDNPIIAADAIYMAQNVVPPRVTPRLRELLYYPDRRVKEQMIALVGEAGGEDAVDLLLGVVDDTDKNVRCRAMEALSFLGGAPVVDRMHELAFAADLNARDADEQEVIFKCLGRVGTGGTVSELERFLEKKNFMQFGKNRENKFLAIRALEKIRSQKSMQLLEKLSHDANNLVKSRATRARDTLAAAMESASSDVTWDEGEAG